MRWSRGSLDRGMGLEEEIPVPGLGDAAVDDGAVFGVIPAIGVFFAGGVEAGLVAFADYDD